MVEKKTFSEPIKCRHCDNRAPMTILFEHRLGDEDEQSGELESETVCQLLECPNCWKHVLREAFNMFDWPHEMMDDFVTVYPGTTSVPVGLPETITKAFEAATKVRKIDANAYGLLIGRLLEMVCADRKAKGETLNEKLSDLAKMGELPNKLVRVAKGLRQLRNIGAHPDLGELKSEDARILDALARAILEYIYTAPHLVRRVEDRLKKQEAGVRKKD